MSRGLPFSLGLHLLTLVMVFVFGNQVVRKQFDPPRTIRVKTVQMPRAQTQPEPPPEVIPEAPAPPKQEIIERAPKELPKAEPPKPEPRKDPEPEPPRPKPVDPDPPPATEQTPAETAPAAPMISGPSVSNTDVDFPFAWYLSRVQGQIARGWNPKKAGFRDDTVVSCTVHFVIARSGGVSQVTLTRSSGIGVFDREALRVVQTARFPRLPPRYTQSSLGVTVVFNLESDL